MKEINKDRFPVINKSWRYNIQHRDFFFNKNIVINLKVTEKLNF